MKAVILQSQGAGHRGAVAVSDRGEHWVLINMAPHAAERLSTDEAPGWAAARTRSIVLTNADVDHVCGLLALRDGSPISLYATPAVFEALSRDFPVLPLLQHYCGVTWHVIPVAGEATCAPFRIDEVPELEFMALSTQGPTPPFVPEHEALNALGHHIALAVRHAPTDRRLFCAPGAVELGYTEMDWMRSADCVLIDGRSTWPAEAPSDDWSAQRKVLLGMAPRAQGGACPDGFECASDGMVIEL